MQRKQKIRKRKKDIKYKLQLVQESGKKIFFFVIFISVFIIFMPKIKIFFYYSDFFKIKKIEIEGISEFVKKDLKKKIEISEGMNIFSININKINKKIKFMKDVYSFKIKKKYPNLIKISFKEREIIALVLKKGKYYCMDQYGIMFEKDIEEVKKYPELVYEDNACRISNMNTLLYIYKTKFFNNSRNITKIAFCKTHIKVFTEKFCYIFDEMNFDDKNLEKILFNIEEKLINFKINNNVIDFRNFNMTGMIVVKNELNGGLQ